ncbi:MAG: type II toxin-antitoxin system VapC family toxin, partial [Treponema sp.]|nr:type II toxin-antitoxin system VapC family toxin [Treponema sp.]
FCSHYPFIHLTESVSYAYGDLKKDLQSHGLTLPENDMWIAATALANNLTVITQDKHFDSIPNLTVIKL